MDFSPYIYPLAGGGLIGGAVSLLLLFNGRIFGVSGIIAGILQPKKNDCAWRVAAVAGLVAAGFMATKLWPKAIEIAPDGPTWRYVVAGLLVGFGTQLGSGCTSGHGICGISRFSARSLVATVVFIAFAMLTVAIFRGVSR